MDTVDEAVLDLVRAGMRGLKAPGHHDKVYKEECMYTFDTPFSSGGLYVNLKTFQVRSVRTRACMLRRTLRRTRNAARCAVAPLTHAMVCPHTPCRQTYVYVMETTQGFGAEFVGQDHEKTGNTLYLHETWTKVIRRGQWSGEGCTVRYPAGRLTAPSFPHHTGSGGRGTIRDQGTHQAGYRSGRRVQHG
jgi:hypothetical protein